MESLSQESRKIFHLHIKVTLGEGGINGHHSVTPDLYGSSGLCLVNTYESGFLSDQNADLVFPEYRSCVSRIQILRFYTTDHRSCVSRMQILCFHNTDHRSCVSRMQISCFHNADPRSCVSAMQI